MRRILPTFIDTRYDIILSRERRLAKGIARSVVEMPEVSVWAYMIPLVFILNFLKYRRTREIFTLNFLFTKKLALEAARDIMKEGQPRRDVLAQIEDKTSDILAADKRGVYAEKIRRKQMNEINLLVDHYLKLLEAEGKSYESLVKNAYQTRDNYEAFLRELTLAEKAVNRAAIQTMGRTQTASELISMMEKATERIRTEEAEKIFS